MPFCWCRINCFRRKCARPCAESYDTLYQFIFISVESHELFPYTAIIAEEGLVPKATIRCISSFSSQLSLRNCVPGRPTHCVLHFYLQGTTTPDTRATPSGCERELIHQQQLPPPTPHNSTRWWMTCASTPEKSEDSPAAEQVAEIAELKELRPYGCCSDHRGRQWKQLDTCLLTIYFHPPMSHPEVPSL
jgi:hypothetical protein